MTGLKRRKENPRVIGPLCEAWDDPDLDKWWPDCYHRSCGTIAYEALAPATGLRRESRTT